jgi:hydroxymethylbilane synthase
MLAVLDGSCNTPIGAYARMSADGTLHLTGLLASTDGTFLIKRRLTGPMGDAALIGAELGAMLKQDAPAAIF